MNKNKIEEYNFDGLKERLDEIPVDRLYYNRTNLLTSAVKIFYILLNSNITNEQDLEQLRNNYKFTAAELKSVLGSRLVDITFTKEEIAKVSKIINMYKAKYGVKNTNKNFKCLSTIKDFMDNHYISIDKYCKDKQMDYRIFNQLLRTLKIADIESYKIFMEYLDKVQIDNFKKIDDIWEEIKEKLLNGVVTQNGNIRPFDIIDYFEITNIPPINLFNIINKRHSNESEINLRLFKTFCNNAFIGNILKQTEIDRLYNCNFQFRNEDGEYVIITIEDKEKIFDYLINNNIPFTQKIYLMAFRRYVNGNLNTDKRIDKVKVFQR